MVKSHHTVRCVLGAKDTRTNTPSGKTNARRNNNKQKLYLLIKMLIHLYIVNEEVQCKCQGHTKLEELFAHMDFPIALLLSHF